MRERRRPPAFLPGYRRRHAGDRRLHSTREAPDTGSRRSQPDAREGQAGVPGVAERLVVPTGEAKPPLKPANPGGGKGPWLKANARSDEGPREIGDEPSTSRKGSEV